MKKMLSLVLALAMLLSVFAGTGIVLADEIGTAVYVDPVNGNDSNSGTSLSPFKTIQAAAKRASELSADSDVTVFLKGGTYAYGETIVFGEAESGKNGHTITYKPMSGDTVTISGGVSLDGWTLHDADKNIYVTDIPEGTELARGFYVNGEPMTNAYIEYSPTDWLLLSSGGYISPDVKDQNSNEYIIMDLGESKLVSSVVLYGGSNKDADGKAAGFPKDFTISTSADGENWEVQVTETDYSAPAIGGRCEFIFDSVAARYVKLNVTKLGTPERLNPKTFNLQLAEVAVGMVAETSDLDVSAIQHLDMTNNLINVNNTQIGYYNDGTTLVNFVSAPHGACPVANAFDGNSGTFASTVGLLTEWLVSAGGTLTMACVFDVRSSEGHPVSVSGVYLAVRDILAGSPTDFRIQTSQDGKNWITVISETDFDWESVGYEYTFAFNPEIASYIRILGDSTVPEEEHSFLQFTEAAIYKPANVALGAEVIAPNNDKPDATWDKDFLCDGIFNDCHYTSSHANSTTSVNAPITVDMNTVKTIGGVRLYPRYVNGEAIQYLTAVRISVSKDGVTWQKVLELNDVDQPTHGPQLFVFPEAQNARYVKIEPLDVRPGGTETTNRFQLEEIEIAPARYAIEDSDGEAEDANKTSGKLGAGLFNMGFICEQTGVVTENTDDTYPFANLVDGNSATVASTGAGMDANWMFGRAMENTTFAFLATVKLDAKSTVDSVALTCAENEIYFAPYDFDIQVSSNGTQWTTVKTVDKYEWTAGETATFTFDAVEAQYVRLYVHMVVPMHYTVEELKTDQSEQLMLRLAELTVFGTAISGETAKVDTNIYTKIDLTAENILGYGWYSTAALDDLNDNWLNWWPQGTELGALVDGNKATSLITDTLSYSYLADFGGSNYPAVLLDTTDANGNPMKIGAVELSVRELGNCAPYHFEIQYADKNGNWKVAKEVKAETWATGNTQKYVFSEVEAYKLRIVCYNMCPQDKNSWTMEDIIANYTDSNTWNTRFCITEISLYNVYDPANPIPSGLITQSGASAAGGDYDIAGVSCKNDNSNNEYNSNKLIDGIITPASNYGYAVPESYHFGNITNPEDVEIHILSLWYHSFYYVTGVSADGTEVYTTAGANRPTWIANAYEFIDNVGEYYINRSEGKIYYKAESTMDGVEAVLPVVEQIVYMKDATNITFDGIIFEHSTYNLPSTIGYVDTQANAQTYNGWTQVNGGVMIDSSTNITITNSVIRNMATAGIKVRSVDSVSDNIQITNNRIYDISYSGIIVGEIYKHNGYESWQLVTNTVIRNNYITRIGIDMFDSPGIVATYTNGTIIDHNEISYCPYTGISTGWGWCNETVKDTGNAFEEVGNLQITNNYVHDVMKTNRDGAAIYNLGSSKGSVISGNYVYNSWDGASNKERVIYLDEGSSWFEVYNNVIGMQGQYWCNMWQASIKENYWHDNYYDASLELRNDGTDNVIENNTPVEDGKFEEYAGAVEIINNAGLLDKSLKTGIESGFAPEHNIVQELYSGLNSRYIETDWGWNKVVIEGQSSTTVYDSATREVTIFMPAGTDLSALKLSYVLDDGYRCEIASGSVVDFTDPVVYTLTNGSNTTSWTVKVKVETEAGGEIVGTDVTLDDAVLHPSDWTVAPSDTTEDGLTFGSYSGYIGERFGSDTILHFDMTSDLTERSKDWLQISLRNRDPYTMCISGNTEYNIGFNWDNIEVQKFVNGERTVLYGDIDGYTATFGTIPNSYYTANERHSITVGAIDVDAGVRLFLFVDGNLVFDIVDADDPITSDGYFAVYGMTHAITVSKFTDIKKNNTDLTALNAAITAAEALNADDYTARSFASVETALSNAKSLINGLGGYNQEMVDAAAETLNAAILALVRVGEGRSDLTITGPVGIVYPYSDSVKEYLTKESGTILDYYISGTMSRGDASITPVQITWDDGYEQVTKYVVEYATSADYANGTTIVKTTDLNDLSVDLYNLYKGTTYYVRVTAYNGETMLGQATSTFKTTSLGARIMNIDSLYNVRDLGGYAVGNGLMIKQDMIFRGCEMNGEHGLSLSEEGEWYLSQVLGIRFDMDLRADSSDTPISSATKEYFSINGYEYAFIETENYRRIFSAFADESNYPMYVHCWGGADRTGTVCFLLNALLGVSEAELIQDFELTSWSIFGVRDSSSEDFEKFITQLNTYEGNTLSEKVENYLLSIGVTETEIANIRTILLEEVSDDDHTGDDENDPSDDKNDENDPSNGEDSPKNGDDTSVVMLVTALGVSVTALAVLVLGKKKYWLTK